MKPPRSRFRSVLLAATLALCVAAGASGQEDSAPVWRVFTRLAGLAANDVVGLYEDSDGGVWFTTAAGVTRFDGLWRTFTRRDGLSSNDVRAVVEEAPGVVWVGTDAGVDRLARDVDGKWLLAAPPNGGLRADIVSLVAAPGEATPTVWAGATDGLYRWSGIVWEMYAPLAGVPIRLLASDAADGLWCVVEGAAEAGPALLHVPAFDSPPAEFPLPGAAATLTVNDMLPLGDRQWWLATSEGVLHFGAGLWVVRDLPPGSPRVTGLSRQAAGGAIWAATDVGLYQLAGAWRLFGAADGLPADAMRDVLVDTQGRLWVATPNGVAMDDGGWTSFAVSQVSVLAADASGALWAGTSAGLDRIAAGRQTFTAVDGLPEGPIQAAAVAPDGAVWVGTSGVRAGLARGLDGVWQSVPLPTGAGRVHAITFDSSGRVWVGTGFLELSGDSARVDILGAASVFDGAAWRTWDLSGTPVSLAEDGEGVMWAATRTHGVLRVGDGDAVSAGPLPRDTRGVVADAGGRLWVATSEGLFRRTGDEWVDTLMPRASATDAVWAVFEDNAGGVWAGSDDGVARRDPSGHWALFGASDGLPPSGIAAIAQTTDDTLWFAGRGGDRLLRRSAARAFPQTRLLSPPRGDIGESAIRLDFAGGDVRTPVDRLRFSYRVNGGAWSAPRLGASEVVTGLPNSQEAVIQVRAVGRDGTADPTPATTIVHVDTTSPTAEITHPEAGDHVRGNVEVRGTAWDETDFEAYAVELPGAQLVESYERVSGDILAAWDTQGVDDGLHVLRLTVRDAVTGDHDIPHTELRQVEVTVDNTPPEAGLTVPAGVVSGAVEMRVGAFDIGLASWRLEYARDDPSGATEWVTIRERATPASLVDARVQWEASTAHGRTRLRLRVVDRAGNSVDVEKSVVLDHPDALPVVTVTEPHAGAVVRGRVRIAGTITDATLDRYTVRVEHASGSDELVPEGSESVVDGTIAVWDTLQGVDDGDYTIVIEARDNNTYRSEERVPVTVDNTPATVDITEPEENAIFAWDQSIQIRATVLDAHATEFVVQTAAEKDAPDEEWTEISSGVVSDGSADALWTPDDSLALRYLRVVVLDQALHRSISAPIAVIVDAGAPSVVIERPADGAIVSGSVAIRGVVDDANLDYYTVSYRTGSDEETIHPRGATPPPGALAVWDTPITDGPATLRVRAVDAVGFEAEATVAVRVDNLDPEASIAEPAAGTQVAGIIDIVGSADDEHFTAYTVEWTLLAGGQATQWTAIAQDVTAPVVDGRLATWDTGAAVGAVRLRVVATDEAGHTGVAERSIVVAGTLRSDRHAVLSSTDGSVRLRLAPNALSGSPSVTVNAESAEAVMGRRPLRVIRIDPVGVALDPRKPGTLEFRLPTDREVAAYGVAEWDATGGAWRYLGGSADDDAGWVRTRVFRLGRYALIPEPAAFAAADVALRLKCQPRAFSPLGGDLPRQASVTFSVREAARVRIRVYNQAGRLARRLADTQSSPGEHAVPWDGRDDMGRTLPNGAYIVQVDCGYAQERQVVVIWNR